jgi:mRNA interferase MazF
VARTIERGDIWLYRFARPDKRRPVLVLSRTAALRLLRTAIVAPVTAAIHGIPSELLVGPADGLKKESAVNFDHLYTVDQGELRQFVGHLDERRMRAACGALEIALGCD